MDVAAMVADVCFCVPRSRAAKQHLQDLRVLQALLRSLSQTRLPAPRHRLPPRPRRLRGHSRPFPAGISPLEGRLAPGRRDYPRNRRVAVPPRGNARARAADAGREDADAGAAGVFIGARHVLPVAESGGAVRNVQSPRGSRASRGEPAAAAGTGERVLE